MNHILSLPFDEGVNVIHLAREKLRKQEAWEYWLAVHPQIKPDKFPRFDQFYRPKANYRPQGKQAILDSVQRFVERTNRKRGEPK